VLWGNWLIGGLGLRIRGGGIGLFEDIEGLTYN